MAGLWLSAAASACHFTNLNTIKVDIQSGKTIVMTLTFICLPPPSPTPAPPLSSHSGRRCLRAQREEMMRSYSQTWPCAPLSPQTATPLPCGVRLVSLPSYQRAVVHLEWDVLLIQCLSARPEMALMVAVMSPPAFLAGCGHPQRHQHQLQGLICPFG